MMGLTRYRVARKSPTLFCLLLFGQETLSFVRVQHALSEAS
jgi:hypothetical protein